MKRSLIVVSVAMIAATTTAGLSPAHAEARGHFTEGTYTSPQGTRHYWLYVPTGGSRVDRPLVVFLHGCIQTAEQAAAATRFNQLADQRNFDVLYPQQNVTPNQSAPFADGNGLGCWNWFWPGYQQRETGEPAVIAGLTRSVMASEHIDENRVYLEGISAGGDMAVIMAATYPDLFAAVGVLAGGPYATWTDLSGRLAYDQMGPRARVVPMFVEQGTADTLNVFPISQALVDSWLGTDDWADDGAYNGSISRIPSSTESHGFDQTPHPGTGDFCIRNNHWPCPGGILGFQGTYPYTVEHYADTGGCDVLDFWVIHGLEHAQPYAPDGPFTDPLGPDVTTGSYDFFSRHTLAGGCTG